MKQVITSLLATALLLSPPLLRFARAQTSDPQIQLQMSEARRYFEALEYEQAVPALDRAIALMQARPLEEVKVMLVEALEVRGRSRFGLADVDGARADFVSLLKIDPAHAMGSQVSPRVVALFDEAKKSTVTMLRVAVTPDSATVLLDGARVEATGEIPVLVGGHTLTASRSGYKPETLTIAAAPETIAEATMVLVRTAAVLSIVTSPADVEVIVDGISRGKTAAGPPPPDLASRATAAGIPTSELSNVLTLTDLATGAHRIELRRPCYVPVERRQEISQLDDYVLEPIRLVPAVAPLVVQSPAPDTMVWVDGEMKGKAPYTSELCEGSHVVELRAPSGRDTRKVDAKAGQRLEIAGTLRPAFAIVASTQSSLNTDFRAAVARAFEPLNSILVFAPAPDALDAALRAEKLPPDWLGYDANRRPFGVAAEVTAAMRRDLSAKLAKAFDAQGIAAVTAPVPANRSRLVLTLLGAGIAEPDVIDINLDQPDTIAAAIAQIDRPLAFLTPTIGVAAIDVADLSGPVIAAVDANGPAAQAGLQAGDVVVSADTRPITDASALATVVAARTGGQSLLLEVKDRSGAQKTAEVKVLMRPRLLGISDQTLLVNRTLVALRARLDRSADPAEQASVRLNLAAALARLDAWNEARTELQQVTLTDGPGVGTGTVQYLLGLCAARLGNRADAETAFKAAAASTNLLTEDGPPVRELAEARLAELQRASQAR